MPKPILVIRFPRALEMDMFYGQMNHLKRDKQLNDDYILLITKDVDMDRMEFDVLQPKTTEINVEGLQHMILRILDSDYKVKLKQFEENNSIDWE